MREEKMSKKKRIILVIVGTVIALSALLFYWDHQIVTPSQELDKSLRYELAHMDNEYFEYDFAVVSYRLFKINESRDEADIYGMFYIEQYEDNGNSINGYLDYMKVTMKKNGNQYKLDKVWTPKDGDQYQTLLLKEFPINTWSRILLTGDRYRLELVKEGRQQYEEYILDNSKK